MEFVVREIATLLHIHIPIYSAISCTHTYTNSLTPTLHHITRRPALEVSVVFYYDGIICLLLSCARVLEVCCAAVVVLGIIVYWKMIRMNNVDII